MTNYYGTKMIQHGEQYEDAIYSSAGNCTNVVFIGTCKWGSSETEGIIGELGRVSPISNLVRYSAFTFDLVSLKDFLQGQTDIVLHCDLLDGLGHLVVTDLLKPLDLSKAELNMTTISNPVTVPIEGSMASLGFLWWSMLLDTDMTPQNRAVTVSTNLSWFSLESAFLAAAGNNDENIVTNRYVEGARRTGFLASKIFKGGTIGLNSPATWSHRLRFRVTSADPLLCIGKQLIMQTTMSLTTSDQS